MASGTGRVGVTGYFPHRAGQSATLIGGRIPLIKGLRLLPDFAGSNHLDDGHLA